VAEYVEIGEIVRLQVQRESLKPELSDDERPELRVRRYFDPKPIIAADALHVADDLVTVDGDPNPVVDVHCVSHPRSRNRGNGNMLSVGFTGHYDKMRDRFGEHLTDGIAGENILVNNRSTFAIEDLEAGLRIETGDGQVLDFLPVTVAAPCVEFSRFCLGDLTAPPLAVKETLQFLDGGTRAFYAYIASGLPVTLRTGDRLFRRV
jgi:hypothetical protein